MSGVSVLTPALPSRERLLAECVASVARQEVPPVEHLVAYDHARAGPSALRNRLALAAASDWLAFLDDDDLLLPNHLRVLLEGAGTGADVVYSYCAVEGRVESPSWSPNTPFDADALRKNNFIPVTCLVRRARFLAVDGFRAVEHGMEDWDLWLRLLDAGARFACVPEVTWVYRFHGGNRTYQEVARFNPYGQKEQYRLEMEQDMDSLQQRFPDREICFSSQEQMLAYRRAGRLPAGAVIVLLERATGRAY